MDEIVYKIKISHKGERKGETVDIKKEKKKIKRKKMRNNRCEEKRKRKNKIKDVMERHYHLQSEGTFA